jgi:hypothetical protein
MDLQGIIVTRTAPLENELLEDSPRAIVMRGPLNERNPESVVTSECSIHELTRSNGGDAMVELYESREWHHEICCS